MICRNLYEPLKFIYNYNRILNILIPDEYSASNTFTIIGSCEGEYLNQPELICFWNFSTNMFNDNIVEFYSVSISEGGLKTIGTMSWTFQYIQTEKTTTNSKTLLPILEGSVATATGVWSSYVNANVTITFNNINNQRDIIIRVCE